MKDDSTNAMFLSRSKIQWAKAWELKLIGLQKTSASVQEVSKPYQVTGEGFSTGRKQQQIPEVPAPHVEWGEAGCPAES